MRPETRLVVVCVLAGAGLGLAAPATARPQQPPSADVERVAIVDLRDPAGPDVAGSRRKLAADLASSAEIAPVTEPGLAEALAGIELPSGTLAALSQDASAAMDEARTAYGNLDCAGAIDAAERAVTLLAALEAAGQAVRSDIRQGYVYQLLCAHTAGNTDLAMRAAQRLHGLGPGADTAAVDAPPPGVSPQIWAQYPLLDAMANVSKIQLVITAELEGLPTPGGAGNSSLAAAGAPVIWLDHREIGRAPLTVVVDEGEHVFAAAAPGTATARRLEVTQRTQEVRLALAAGPGPGQRGTAASDAWASVAQSVARWRSAGLAGPAPDELGALMRRIDVRIVLLLGPEQGSNAVAIWSLGPGETVARQAGSGTMTDAAELVTTIRRRARRWDTTGLNPSTSLLLESNRSRSGQSDSANNSRTAWWMYATFFGAVAIAGAVILANDLADDHQRIQLQWP